MRRFLTVTALLLSVIMILPALSSCARLSSTKEEKEAVMKIGDRDIPYELYRYLALNFKRDCPEATEDELREMVASSLLDICAVLESAEKNGIDTGSEYFDEAEDNAVQLAQDDVGGRSEYKKKLAGAFMNDSVFRFLSRKSAVNDELYERLTAEALKKFEGDAGAALVMSDEFVCVKQVLITAGERSAMGDFYFVPAGAAASRTPEEAKALAEEVLGKALAGEDFDALVDEYSDSFYMIRNTDGYYLCRGMWEEVNENAVFALAEGEISKVIESDAGFSVFLRCPKNEEYVKGNLDTISENYCRAYFNTRVEETRAGLTVEALPALDRIQILTMEFEK